MNDLTCQLNRIGESRSAGVEGGISSESLLPLVYEELRRLAAQRMAREPAGHTLQPTALVHEAWMRVGGEGRCWESRAHFYGAAAEAMRRILIETARRRHAARHGGNLERVDVHAIEIEAPVPEDKLLALHEALDLLAEHDPRKAELVKLRYFAGLSIEEAADVLGVSTPTAKRDWTYARAWMFRQIQDGSPTSDCDPVAGGRGDGGGRTAR